MFIIDKDFSKISTVKVDLENECFRDEDGSYFPLGNSYAPMCCKYLSEQKIECFESIELAQKQFDKALENFYNIVGTKIDDKTQGNIFIGIDAGLCNIICNVKTGKIGKLFKKIKEQFPYTLIFTKKVEFIENYALITFTSTINLSDEDKILVKMKYL